MDYINVLKKGDIVTIKVNGEFVRAELVSLYIYPVYGFRVLDTQEIVIVGNEDIFIQ